MTGPERGYDILREKLEKTYRTYRQGLFSLALSITGSRSMAEDAVQSAFERLCRSSAAVNPNGDFVAYVFACVRNAACDAVQSRRRTADLRDSIYREYRHDNADVELPNDALLTAERYSLLQAAMNELDDSDREVILLKVYSEMTFATIGSVLNLPAATAATRYRRALTKLEEKLRGQL